jgi:RNA polymerase sigma factor (sigma-70 family)
VDDHEMLAQAFEGQRPHLQSVAYRMLGSFNEAEDAVQEAWIRLARTDRSDVENLGGWLTTVVSRVCLDMLRSRNVRREEAVGVDLAEHADAEPGEADPQQQVAMADSVGLAMLVVLDTLSPAERLAFVLHDMFALPFDEIAPIVGRSPDATKMLASRARRRVQGVSAPTDADRRRQREVVDAFLAASRGGAFDTLVALLDPDVVLRSDAVAVKVGADREARGASAVASTFSGRAREARLALIDGSAGAVWGPGGEPRVVFVFTLIEGRIVAIEIVADPERIGTLELVFLDN